MEGRVQCGSQFKVQFNKVESQGGRHLKRPVTSRTESDEREVEMKACQDSAPLPQSDYPGLLTPSCEGSSHRREANQDTPPQACIEAHPFPERI